MATPSYCGDNNATVSILHNEVLFVTDSNVVNVVYRLQGHDQISDDNRLHVIDLVYMLFDSETMVDVNVICSIVPEIKLLC